jgi:hypothetical protein
MVTARPGRNQNHQVPRSAVGTRSRAIRRRMSNKTLSNGNSHLQISYPLRPEEAKGLSPGLSPGPLSGNGLARLS